MMSGSGLIVVVLLGFFFPRLSFFFLLLASSCAWLVYNIFKIVVEVGIETTWMDTIRLYLLKSASDQG
jgi:hypothetical protein